MEERVEKVIYAAGFFDGEGSVGTPYKRFLAVRASQVDPRPLVLLRDLFGGAIRQHHTDAASRAKGWKPAWTWILQGQPAAEALAEMLPYLIVKRDVAELGIALSALTQRHGGSWSRAGNPGRRAEQEAIGQKIRDLNDYRGGKARRA